MAAKSNALARIDKKNVEQLLELQKQSALPLTLTRLVNLAIDYGMPRLRKVLMPPRKTYAQTNRNPGD